MQTTIFKAFMSSFAILFIVQGCAGVKWNKVRRIETVPPPAEGAVLPDASYEFRAVTKEFSESNFKEGTREILRVEFAEAMRELGYFSKLKEEFGEGNKNLRINIQVKRTNKPLATIPAILTGYSLYTIPSFAGERWEVTADVITQNGEKYNYSFVDGFTLVQWLPMAFVFPFSNPASAPKAIRVNIYKNLLWKMQRDGLIPKSLEGKEITMGIHIDISPMANENRLIFGGGPEGALSMRTDWSHRIG